MRVRVRRQQQVAFLVQRTWRSPGSLERRLLGRGVGRGGGTSRTGEGGRRRGRKRRDPRDGGPRGAERKSQVAAWA